MMMVFFLSPVEYQQLLVQGIRNHFGLLAESQNLCPKLNLDDAYKRADPNLLFKVRL